MVHRYTGTQVQRHTGTPVRQYTATSVHRCIGTSVHRYTDKPVHWYCGIPKHRYTGTPVHQYTGALVRRNISTYTGAPIHSPVRLRYICTGSRSCITLRYPMHMCWVAELYNPAVPYAYVLGRRAVQPCGALCMRSRSR